MSALYPYLAANVLVTSAHGRLPGVLIYTLPLISLDKQILCLAMAAMSPNTFSAGMELNHISIPSPWMPGSSVTAGHGAGVYSPPPFPQRHEAANALAERASENTRIRYRMDCCSSVLSHATARLDHRACNEWLSALRPFVALRPVTPGGCVGFKLRQGLEQARDRRPAKGQAGRLLRRFRGRSFCERKVTSRQPRPRSGPPGSCRQALKYRSKHPRTGREQGS